jgi:hypothetical protein
MRLLLSLPFRLKSWLIDKEDKLDVGNTWKYPSTMTHVNPQDLQIYRLHIIISWNNFTIYKCTKA